MQIDYLFNHLSEVILGYQKDLPILVGIDGVDASGQTHFKDNLDDKLKKSKRNTVILGPSTSSSSDITRLFAVAVVANNLTFSGRVRAILSISR